MLFVPQNNEITIISKLLTLFTRGQKPSVKHSSVRAASVSYAVLLAAAFECVATSQVFSGDLMRWQVNGAILQFNSRIPYADDPTSTELIQRDVNEFKLYVMDNPQLEAVSISGPGGYGPASISIAETIMEFGLDTHAFGECLSACTRIFLAGDERTLAEGASLGFHRPYVIGEEERNYYLAQRDERGWDDEFDYVEFIYDVGLTDMLESVEFMLSRGVTFEFISQAHSVDGYGMWYPEPLMMFKSGVMTQMPNTE